MIRPFYQRGPVTLYHGDAREIAPRLHRRGIVFCDPPYSPHVHEKAVARARHSPLLDGNGRATPCSLSRTVDLGFEALTPDFRRFLAEQARRLASRWALFFTDTEGLGAWRDDLNAAGIEYRTHLTWIKECSTPQFTGMQAAIGDEMIALASADPNDCVAVAHCAPSKELAIPRRFWNGGGKLGVYRTPIVNGAHGKEVRIHETQKPERLIQELVEDWTEPGEHLIDLCAGACTLGVIAIRIGRTAVLVEQRGDKCELAAQRLDAELSGAGHRLAQDSADAGQITIFERLGGMAA